MNKLCNLTKLRNNVYDESGIIGIMHPEYE